MYVQLIPNTEIFATQLQMELTVTSRRLATQCTCIQFSVIIIIIITDTAKFEVSVALQYCTKLDFPVRSTFIIVVRERRRNIQSVDGEEGGTQKHILVISRFCGEVDEIYPLLGYCAAYSDNFLPTFRDNLSAPSSGVLDLLTLNMGPIGCPETSARNFRHTLRNISEERRLRPRNSLARS
jgi:hypothetical protein